MKKTIRFVGLMLIAVMSWSLTACGSDDDDEPSIKSQLIGIWSTSLRSSNWKYIEIKANGTILFDLSKDDDGNFIHLSTSEAHWSYNETDNIISMYTDSGYYTFTFKVNMANDGNSWAGYSTNSNGNTVSFVRQKGSVIKKETK